MIDIPQPGPFLRRAGQRNKTQPRQFINLLRFQAKSRIQSRLSEIPNDLDSQATILKLAFDILNNSDSISVVSRFEEDLWKTLVSVAVIKSDGPPFETLSHNLAQVVLENNADRGLDFLPAEPTDEITNYFVEILVAGLRDLDGPARLLAYFRLSGFMIPQVAHLLDCTTEKIEQDIDRIRCTWIRLRAKTCQKS